MTAEPDGSPQSLSRVVLEGEALTRLSPVQAADQAQAVADLQIRNSFAPNGLLGPFVLRLSVFEGRLMFDVRDEADAPLTAVGLALGPFRGLIKDYQMLVDSHMKAIEEGRGERIQAIDMGRRGLHDEGAALLTERLAGKIRIDHETARRLFTLVCVLHQRV